MVICCVYLPPSARISRQDLEGLLSQLPFSVFLLMDFNGHSPGLGASSDAREELLGFFKMESDLWILNDFLSAIQQHFIGCWPISCQSNIIIRLYWTVHTDLYGNNHFPIILQSSASLEQDDNFYNSGWNHLRQIDLLFKPSSPPAYALGQVLI